MQVVLDIVWLPAKAGNWRGFLRKRMDTGKETQNVLLNGNFNILKQSYYTTFTY